jgi:hypothetical protein
MLIDTDAGTVTFKADTTLSLDQLWGLIDLLDEDIDSDINRALRSLTAAPVHPSIDEIGRVPANEVMAVVPVRSQTTSKYYIVAVFADGSYACSCPDWIHRRSKEPYSSPCKHMMRLHYSLDF